VAFQAEKNQCAVTFIDITENKRVQKELIDLNRDLEKRVEERTKELLNSQAALLNLVEDIHEKSSQLQKNKEKLEAKNKELETFTYSVSHDLKAPLRGIDGYSRLLEELYSDKLTGEGPRFIQSIREGTKQMNQLIEDLLAYSRLERSIFRFAKIKIRELIETVLLLLQNEISAKNVNIEILVDDCLIETDYDGLSIVLRNLVENAIKFSATQKQAQIKILFKDNVNSWSIIVEDNGIGFDMKYHDRIFEIFQRLNLPEQYAGTGIGLAMVSKSVERMNGKIWAESSPGNGAKFYLEIPKNQKT
jgi:light-regulated signal transduction histidine kinase (bacteriophytochrome)